MISYTAKEHSGGKMEKELTQCLHSVRAGAPGAFNHLAEQYKPLILSQVDRMLPGCPPNTIGRDDLIQEANIALYRAAISYDEQQNGVTFGLYAKICIRNRLISALRRVKRMQKKPKVEVSPHTQHNDLDYELLKEKLHGLLTRYEEQVLGLRAENYSYKEIAEKLSTDPKSIDNALYRIRKKIRQINTNTL